MLLALKRENTLEHCALVIWWATSSLKMTLKKTFIWIYTLLSNQMKGSITCEKNILYCKVTFYILNGGKFTNTFGEEVKTRILLNLRILHQ